MFPLIINILTDLFLLYIFGSLLYAAITILTEIDPRRHNSQLVKIFNV